MDRRILVATRDLASLQFGTERLKESAPDFEFDRVSPLEASIDRLKHEDFQAVVCCLESPEDVEPARRIRVAEPEIAIVLAPSNEEAARAARPLLGEASSLAMPPRDPEVIARHLLEIARLREVCRANEVHRARAAALHAELRSLKVEGERAYGRSRLAARSQFRPRFVPLVVVDDPDQALLLIRAFEKTEVPGPIGMVSSADQATAYLSGRSPFEDRGRYPQPTMVLLDLHRSGGSGLELLSWIRNASPLPKLPVIILSGSVNQKDIDQAYECRANSVLVKPGSFEALVEMMRALHFYWTRINVGWDDRL